MNLMLIVATVVAALLVSPIDCQVYPSDKLFAPALETICYEVILDSCGNDPDDLSKPGYQIYCMFCRGGVHDTPNNKDIRKPKASINFANLYARLYGCFKDEKYIDCAYKIIYDKFRDTLFDLSNPGSNEFVSLQNTLAQLYRKGKSYC